MILGILSDTHGRQQRTARAIRILRGLGAEAFVHCGDIGGVDVLAEFAGLRTWFVWGNIDVLDPTLARYAESLGLQPPEEIPTRIELGGRSLAVYHGHEPHFTRLLRQIERCDFGAFTGLVNGADYVLYGHTHTAADARFEGVRMINPGALQRVAVHTVATLDLARDELAFWEVDEHADDDQPPQRFTPYA